MNPEEARTVRDTLVSRPIPAQRRSTELCWPNPRVAMELWSHLAQARADYDPRILAEAEEAVFRFYLPLAHHVAGDHADSDEVGHPRTCAELGLAKAILGWTLPDEARFEDYARHAIQSEILHNPDYPPTHPTPLHGRVERPYTLARHQPPAPG